MVEKSAKLLEEIRYGCVSSLHQTRSKEKPEAKHVQTKNWTHLLNVWNAFDGDPKRFRTAFKTRSNEILDSFALHHYTCTMHTSTFLSFMWTSNISHVMGNGARCLVLRTLICQCLYTIHTGKDVCPLAARVRIVAKELGFIRLS